MFNFWDFNVWTGFNIMAVLLLSLLVANILRKSIPFLRDSLIPVSVLGGGVLVLVAAIYKWITGEVMFDTEFFGGNGTEVLEMITYHCLALGFIASTFRPSRGKRRKARRSGGKSGKCWTGQWPTPKGWASRYGISTDMRAT